MDVVIMAAGEGRRLRPLTERWAKPILPIDGRAVIAVLLRELAAAGLTRVTVVTGHLAEQVEALVANGSGFGIEAHFVRQPEPDGSADAVRRGLAGGATPPALLVAADTVFASGTIARFATAWGNAGTAGALAYRHGLEPTPSKAGVRLVDGLIREVYDLDPSLAFTSAPLWALGPELAPFLERVPGPPYELKDAYQQAIDAGLRISGIEVGPTRDLTRPEDLMVQNFAYLPLEP
ncbi:MAG: NTP transferase domain-containing protein [Actinomycetota bacterium]|nr:NTP transferase domain-containing protein [Actinomycetota bacterium]